MISSYFVVIAFSFYLLSHFDKTGLYVIAFNYLLFHCNKTGSIWMGKQTLSLSVYMATKLYVWVSTWMCAMISFAWISNHHHHMQVMEMIWGIPLFLSHLVKEHPDIHHVPPFVGLLSQTSTFWPKPWPRMEISNLTLGRENRRIFQEKLPLPWVINVRWEKRKEKNQSIRDRRKAK